MWEADKLQLNKLKFIQAPPRKEDKQKPEIIFVDVCYIYVRAALLPECYPELDFMLTIASVYAISDEDFW